ncbi:MAG: tetraacyldisaccharide 4'-kinase [Bacteroidales bacterium]|jgi:tetraacyldisaccharide 4'-kinase
MNSWKIILFPFAWIYGLAIRFRHLLFDLGVLKSTTFNIPMIGVGNLSLGGTGKTPFVEYLIRMFSDDYKVSVLSRGYGRKTKGFLFGNQYSTHYDIGDEPMQYLRKFEGKVKVAVDEDRVDGVKNLTEDDANLELILLDDVFQHRYIQPGLSILLTDINKLYNEDYLLPVGGLRDVVAQAKRADIVVVTKTNKMLSPITKRRVKHVLKLLPHQSLYFSYINYGKAIPFVEDSKFEWANHVRTIVMFAGIANSYPFQEYLRDLCSELIVLDYPDHYQFKRKDLEHIRKTFEDTFAGNKILVTTEKDAMRLLNSDYFSELKNLPLFYIPIEMKMHGLDETNLSNQLKKYVEENSRNG